ncbi:hypothetical protein [Lichenicola sp.]|uniref:hypothetical protein n=1 Tax=Lichenicola sp. TaxID=2804529 RepID=UPI003AFFB828
MPSSDDRRDQILWWLRPLAGKTLPVLASLHVVGDNTTSTAQRVILRVDDYADPAYADRVDDGRVLPAGPFDFTARIGLLATPSGRRLNMATLAQAIAFTGVADVNVTGVTITDAPTLPRGDIAWYFGPAAAAPLYGFQQVLATDPRVTKGVAIQNPGHEPIPTNGIMTTEFDTPLANGSYHLTMWTEDAGNWQNKPPLLQRRIEVNGAVVTYQTLTWDQWVSQGYVAGRAIEADPTQAPFFTVSAQRGGMLTTDVTVTGGMLRISLAGYPAAALYLAAMVAEPRGPAPTAAGLVQAQRALAFASDWPVVSGPPTAPNATALTAVRSDASGTAVTTAPGGFGYLTINVTSPSAASASATVAWGAKSPIEAQAWWNMWRWRRVDASSQGLKFDNGMLRGDIATIAMNPRLPRGIIVAFNVPATTLPGNYHGRVQVTQGGSSASVPFYVEVLAAVRPAPVAKVGPFLDFAPQWVNQVVPMTEARQQAACDLGVLSWFGFTTVVPPLEAPIDSGTLAAYLAELGNAERTYGTDLVAYAPLKGMDVSIGRGAPAAAKLAVVADKACSLTPGERCSRAPVYRLDREASGRARWQRAISGRSSLSRSFRLPLPVPPRSPENRVATP